jgi:phosphinothricin acetyltransferase
MTGRPGSGQTITVRDARTTDLPIVEAIYAHHVLHGLASFEEVPPEASEIERRYRDIVGRGLPFVVAELNGRAAAYAYAGPYRARPAYRYAVEDSVYVAADASGRGLGRAALAEIIDRTTSLGYRQMIAIIGDSGNVASIRLHEGLGFRHAGTLRSVGFKLGRWVDSVLMQRSLGHGDSRPPPG